MVFHPTLELKVHRLTLKGMKQTFLFLLSGKNKKTKLKKKKNIEEGIKKFVSFPSEYVGNILQMFNIKHLEDDCYFPE